MLPYKVIDLISILHIFIGSIKDAEYVRLQDCQLFLGVTATVVNIQQGFDDPFSLTGLMTVNLQQVNHAAVAGHELLIIDQAEIFIRDPRKALFDLIHDSASNSDMTLCLCLSYGGREEITAVTRRIAQLTASGEIDPEKIDEKMLDQHIWSSELGSIDFLIRTSGEQRISNFMLWGLSYAELYFTDLYWPDFGEAALDEALEAFNQRLRRFGKVV